MTDEADVDEPILVDTAALAFALKVTPAQVRRMAQSGYISAVGTTRTKRMGAPSLLFDLTAVEKRLAERRAELDQAQDRV